ncbi:unnamed protein product [Paramecium sonneborni]|uniref:Uncharacterized protein n=1 Tax=Paramecium sonneborni TaxID=65129 RepID=A0A8S1LZT9_9CILI|nr:unnamed protein product [Paramecium sonneborni]
MFIKRIASSFSKSHHHLVIPYYNKGIQNPINNRKALNFVTEDLNMKDPDGFIYAFNNVIASINHEDFIEFANQTCDSELVKGFQTGFKRLKDNNQFIEPIYDPEIEEEILFSAYSVCFELDDGKSYYLQKPNWELDLIDMKIEFYNIFHSMIRNPITSRPKLTVILDCFIKCKTSIKIQNFELHPYSYHAVKFMSQKHKHDTNILTLLKESNFEKLLLGKNYNWRIINIDNFLKR